MCPPYCGVTLPPGTSSAPSLRAIIPCIASTAPVSLRASTPSNQRTLGYFEHRRVKGGLRVFETYRFMLHETMPAPTRLHAGSEPPHSLAPSGRSSNEILISWESALFLTRRGNDTSFQDPKLLHYSAKVVGPMS